jgi:hypothetical protein
MGVNLNSKWPQVGQQVHASASAGTKKVAEKMRANMLGELNKPKSGRIYHGHQASAPGESPSTDTTALEDSLEVLPDENGKGHAVQSDSAHAVHLEFGTKKMARRPLWDKVAEEMQQEVPEIIAAEIRESVSKV